MPRMARLEARLPGEIHALLKRAAELEGRTLTDFVVAAAFYEHHGFLRLGRPETLFMPLAIAAKALASLPERP